MLIQTKNSNWNKINGKISKLEIGNEHIKNCWKVMKLVNKRANVGNFVHAKVTDIRISCLCVISGALQNIYNYCDCKLKKVNRLYVRWGSKLQKRVQYETKQCAVTDCANNGIYGDSETDRDSQDIGEYDVVVCLENLMSLSHSRKKSQ